MLGWIPKIPNRTDATRNPKKVGSRTYLNWEEVPAALRPNDSWETSWAHNCVISIEGLTIVL